MKNFIETMENLPLIAKIILAIPMLDIVWVVYRIVRSAEKQSTFGILLGVLLLIIGIPFLWLIDIITIIVKGNVWWIDWLVFANT